MQPDNIVTVAAAAYGSVIGLKASTRPLDPPEDGAPAPDDSVPVNPPTWKELSAAEKEPFLAMSRWLQSYVGSADLRSLDRENSCLGLTVVLKGTPYEGARVNYRLLLEVMIATRQGMGL